MAPPSLRGENFKNEPPAGFFVGIQEPDEPLEALFVSVVSLVSVSPDAFVSVLPEDVFVSVLPEVDLVSVAPEDVRVGTHEDAGGADACFETIHEPEEPVTVLASFGVVPELVNTSELVPALNLPMVPADELLGIGSETPLGMVLELTHIPASNCVTVPDGLGTNVPEAGLLEKDEVRCLATTGKTGSEVTVSDEFINSELLVEPA